MPFYKIEQVLITTSGASFSSDAVKKCANSGIPITFLARDGTPYAQIQSPHFQGTVLTRRAQLLAFTDKRGLLLGKAFAQGKVANQIYLLKYMAKYRKNVNPSLYERIYEQIKGMEGILKGISEVKGQTIDDVRATLLNMEGRSANLYWQTVAEILPETAGFSNREKRGAADLTNSLLNYGYGILYSQVWVAIILAGLDPYAGFLHVDRPGKPSLVLDLIEEFRQPIVDETIFGMLGRNIDFQIEEGKLGERSTRELAEKILNRLDSKERYRRRKCTLRTIIQCQARSIATFVRGESSYKPFVSSW
ncbi:MAG: CRISPR-associated endonuclease Cas1 [Actinomycetota bacterium]|nr:CRISPR-associated endonuclease Cas1 [Actinomycetota bacterium]